MGWAFAHPILGRRTRFAQLNDPKWVNIRGD